MRLYSLVSKLGHLGEWPECSMRLFEKWARVSLTERHVEFGLSLSITVSLWRALCRDSTIQFIFLKDYLAAEWRAES